MKAPFLLITRPVKDAISFARALDVPLCPVVEPMIDITYSPRFIEGVSSYIFTSRHALFALKDAGYDFSSSMAYCVGKKTATLCYELGFRHVMSAENGVLSLINMIDQYHDRRKVLHYFSGSVVSYDLVGSLFERGYVVQQVEVYQQHYRDHLSARSIALIKNQLVWGITFFSRESVNHFFKSLLSYQDDDIVLDNVNIFCLSSDIACIVQDAWLKDGYGRIFFPQRIDPSAMIEIIGHVYNNK